MGGKCRLLRRAATIAALAILVGASGVVAQTDGENHEVREAVAAFARAYMAADVRALGDLLTHDYIHVNGGTGRVLNRETWLAWIAERRQAMNAGQLVIDEYDVGDLEIRIHGATAIVIGSVTSLERRNGAEVRSRVRFTNVWIREAAGWRRAAFHDSSPR